MRKTMRAALALGALGVLSTGCSSTGSGGSDSFADPSQGNVAAGPLPQPSAVIASISSGSLGDECTSCESNMQIAFDARMGSQSATIQVVSVTLLESATNTLVDTLAVSNPRVWNGAAYVHWDQTVKPRGDLKASYGLAAPAWSKIDGSEAGRYGSAPSYSKSFKLHVTLRVDGLEMIIESTALDRQSPSPPT